jgi:hypothetical protein
MCLRYLESLTQLSRLVIAVCHGYLLVNVTICKQCVPYSMLLSTMYQICKLWGCIKDWIVRPAARSGCNTLANEFTADLTGLVILPAQEIGNHAHV